MLASFDECKRLVRQQLLLVLHGARERRTELVSLEESLNRILAEDVIAPFPIPSHSTSIKDGYAIRCADLALANMDQGFEVQFHSHAGCEKELQTLQHGKVAYVTTGSPLPLGADAVVEVEQTTFLQDRIRIQAGAKIVPGLDVRSVGSDLMPGVLMLKAGVNIGPGEIGALASIGRFRGIRVFARPVVALLATGNELAGGSEESQLKLGQVFDCNRPMLLAAIKELGCTGIDLGILRDTEAETKLDGLVNDAFAVHGADILLTTGGVSVGNADCIRLYLERQEECGKTGTRYFKVLFNRVNIKPGKPMTCAVREPDQVLFSLPGNPVSALAMFHTMVAPLLRELGGCATGEPNSVFSQTACDIVLDVRPEFQRVSLEANACSGVLRATPTGLQRSSCIMSLVGSDALVRLPSSKQTSNGVLPKGSMVETLVFTDWRRTKFPRISEEDTSTLAVSLLHVVMLDGGAAENEAALLANCQRICNALGGRGIPAKHQLVPFIQLDSSLTEAMSGGVVLITSTTPTPTPITTSLFSGKNNMLLLQIPGIAQHIRDHLQEGSWPIWDEMPAYAHPKSCTLVLDLSAVRFPPNQLGVEDLISPSLPLLRGAWEEMKRKL